VKEGRGSPHGGVFLDISWIKEKIPSSIEHIKKKLPSMYHQFKQLADIDITKEPMEIGPTMHYVMGGVMVDAETQMSTVQGLFAAGECSAGLHGANRLGGNSLSDLLVFGQRAGEFAAKYAKGNAPGKINMAEVDETARKALEPFERGASGENPFAIQYDLQVTMQNLVGIVRQQEEMEKAVVEIEQLKQRAAKAGITGNREYNNGWHTALDLDNLLTIAEIVARAGAERKESRGGHFRDDYPEKDPKWGAVNIRLDKSPDGGVRITHVPIKEMPSELKQVIEENK